LGSWGIDEASLDNELPHVPLDRTDKHASTCIETSYTTHMLIVAYVLGGWETPLDGWLCLPNGSISRQRSGWVTGTQGRRIVVLQAKGAHWNRPGLSREGLIIKTDQFRFFLVVSHLLLALVISLSAQLMPDR